MHNAQSSQKLLGDANFRGGLGYQELLWLLGSLCSLYRIPFDPKLEQDFSPPHQRLRKSTFCRSKKSIILPSTANQRYFANTERPAYRAEPPSASSIRSRRLYLATRSERDSDPVLICPQQVATARSAIVTSSDSPERCENTAL